MGIHRAAIVTVALALCVGAITGCGAPALEPPPPTEAEIAAMREAQAQAWWDALSTGTTMPEIAMIEDLPEGEAFERQAQCLEEAQLPGVTVRGPGEWVYDGSDPEDPTGQRANVQWWICAQQFPADIDLNWMLSPRQLDWLYERHIPCLRTVGYEPTWFPTREQFIDSGGYPGWLPFPEGLSPVPPSSHWTLLANRCPLPEMVLGYGVPGYTD